MLRVEHAARAVREFDLVQWLVGKGRSGRLPNDLRVAPSHMETMANRVCLATPHRDLLAFVKLLLGHGDSARICSTANTPREPSGNWTRNSIGSFNISLIFRKRS